MKFLGLLAVLAAGFLSIASGPAQAMPIKLSFSGSILDPSECGAASAFCDPRFYEPSPGGIFAFGQSVMGTMVYDPGSLTGTTVDPTGSIFHTGAARDLSFSIASNSGAYAADFTGSIAPGSVNVCGVFSCTLSSGEQFITVFDQAFPPVPPQVVGTILVGGGLLFLNDEGLLSSSALLPAEELLSVIDQSRQFFFLAFVGADKCTSELCFVIAEISVRVPEPTVSSLLGIGLVGLIVLRRRKKTSSKLQA